MSSSPPEQSWAFAHRAAASRAHALSNRERLPHETANVLRQIRSNRETIINATRSKSCCHQAGLLHHDQSPPRLHQSRQSQPIARKGFGRVLHPLRGEVTSNRDECSEFIGVADVDQRREERATDVIATVGGATCRGGDSRTVPQLIPTRRTGRAPDSKERMESAQLQVPVVSSMQTVMNEPSDGIV